MSRRWGCRFSYGTIAADRVIFVQTYCINAKYHCLSTHVNDICPYIHIFVALPREPRPELGRGKSIPGGFIASGPYSPSGILMMCFIPSVCRECRVYSNLDARENCMHLYISERAVVSQSKRWWKRFTSRTRGVGVRKEYFNTY